MVNPFPDRPATKTGSYLPFAVTIFDGLIAFHPKQLVVFYMKIENTSTFAINTAIAENRLRAIVQPLLGINEAIRLYNKIISCRGKHLISLLLAIR